MSTADPVARVDLPLPASATPRDVVTTCATQSSIIKQCPAYATTPAVQTAVVAMDAAVAVLSGTVGALDNLRAQVRVLEKSRGMQMGTVRLTHEAVETALNTAAAGDAGAAQAWVGKLKERTKPAPLNGSTNPPVDARFAPIKSQPGAVMASCEPEAGAVGYLFQQGGDPAHPETWPAPFVSRGSTFKLRNQTAGQVLYARVAIVRRGSLQGQWSPVLQVMVR